MKASELRIGNFVFDRGGKILRIDYWESRDKVAQKMLVNGTEVHPMTEEIDFLNPITLTIDWLYNFRFEDYDIINIGLRVHKKSIPDQGQTFDIIKDYRGIYVMSNDLNFWSAPIEYVHQLQNLYFALTGKELERL